MSASQVAFLYSVVSAGLVYSGAVVSTTVIQPFVTTKVTGSKLAFSFVNLPTSLIVSEPTVASVTIESAAGAKLKSPAV